MVSRHIYRTSRHFREREEGIMISKKDKDLQRLATWNSMTTVAIAVPSPVPALPMPPIVTAKHIAETREEPVPHNEPFVVEPMPTPGCLTAPESIHDLARQLEGSQRLVMDLETTGLNPRNNKVVTIALGTSDNVCIIDVRRFYTASVTMQSLWCDALQTLFHREGIEWAGHNLKFDWSFMAAQFGVRMQRVYDTMLVEKLIHNGSRVSASLLNTAARYGIEVTKEARNWFIALDQRPLEWNAPLPAAQLRYIKQDIIVPHRVIEAQRSAIDSQGLQRVVDLENAALPAIASIEVNGLLVDTAKWRGILEAKNARKIGLEKEIKAVLSNALADKAAGDTAGRRVAVRLDIKVNLGSRDQLIAALKCLGVRVYDTRAESFEDVKDKHPVVAQLLEWKNLEKFISAFGDSILNKVESDGRIHATFDQLGAVSGRIICRDPNLQQMPKSNNPDEDLRSCFVAPEGHVLLVADLSNIELRILAEISGDATMLRFFAEGKDLHAETARLMFKLGDGIDTKKHLINGVKARDIAKTINFGIAYGMGPGSLATRIGVSPDDAKKLLATYKATYDGVVSYLDNSSRKAIQQRYVASLSGRRRTFLAETLQDSQTRGEAERSARNHPIQGTNADIIKRAMALLSQRLPQDIRIVHAVHDELVLEVSATKVVEAENILKSSMVEACRDFLKAVAIPEPDVLIAQYWVKG